MNRRAWLMIALLSALWGASYLFIKIALRDMSPVVIVAARTLLGSLVIMPFALRAGAVRELRDNLRPLLIVSCVQIVGPFLLITDGEHHISSSLAGILVASAPIFTALLAIWMDQAERSHGWRLAGVFVGIVGVALLFGVDLSGTSSALLGGGMVLLAGLGYAIGALYLKRSLGHLQPVGVTVGILGISGMLLLPAVPFTLPADVPALGPVAAVLALGAGGTGIAFLLFYTLISDVGPARASVVAYIAPGFAVGYGVALLGESITAGTIAGLALILLGSWLAAEGRLSRRPAREVAVAGPMVSPGPERA